VTPQDFYTIYNVNPAFSGGELATRSTVAVIEESDIEYGTVNGTTASASGGDVATFRRTCLAYRAHLEHARLTVTGYTVTCNDPGIDPSSNGEDEEASLGCRVDQRNGTIGQCNLHVLRSEPR